MTNSTVLKLLSVSCMILFVFTGINPLFQAETMTTDSYPLLVITADEFADELQPLIVHKENM